MQDVIGVEAPIAGAVALADLDLTRDLRTVFQPIVDLASGEAVGYEALTRGPLGTPLEDANALFAAARREGHLVELDWAARRAAVDVARRSGFRHPLTLFVNAEPEALSGPSGGDAHEWQLMGDLRCFAEITERALTDHPGELLRLADLVRSQDWGIALDDIGANPQTMALMPMLQPDVLKLDFSMLHHYARLDVCRATHALLAQAGETGATVIAEGIETEQQRDLAVALGAGLGQGHFLGRPGPLPEVLPNPLAPVGLLPRLRDRAVTPSPFVTVNDETPAHRVTHAALEAVWHQLEQQASALRPTPVVLASFASRREFSARFARLAALSHHLPLVAAFGPVGVAHPVGGLRVQTLDEHDTTNGERNLIVIGPQYAAALVARPLPDGNEDGDYDAVLTFGRPLVVRAANALLMRLHDDSLLEQPTS